MKMTIDNFVRFMECLRDAGYEFMTHAEYMLKPESRPGKVVLLRHDIDADIQMRAIDRLVAAQKEFGVASSIFIRLRDPMYNPFGFHEIGVIKRMIDAGCEIGLHSESLDVAWVLGNAWTPAEVLHWEARALRSHFDLPVVGVAPHGDLTGNNNQDVFADIDLKDYGFEYMAYDLDGGPFSDWYISCFAGNNWKRYIDGRMMETRTHSYMDYAKMAVEQGVKKITFNLHCRSWCENHYLSV